MTPLGNLPMGVRISTCNFRICLEMGKVELPEIKNVVFTVLFNQLVTHTIHNQPCNSLSANLTLHILADGFDGTWT